MVMLTVISGRTFSAKHRWTSAIIAMVRTRYQIKDIIMKHFKN